MIKESIEYGRTLSCVRFLADYRQARLDLSFARLFERARLYSHFGLPSFARVALVLAAGFADKDFVEAACQNRGYNLRVFASLEEAIQWLTTEGTMEKAIL